LRSWTELKKVCKNNKSQAEAVESGATVSEDSVGAGIGGDPIRTGQLIKEGENSGIMGGKMVHANERREELVEGTDGRSEVLSSEQAVKEVKCFGHSERTRLAALSDERLQMADSGRHDTESSGVGGCGS
jgi:hypothetical protein